MSASSKRSFPSASADTLSPVESAKQEPSKQVTFFFNLEMSHTGDHQMGSTPPPPAAVKMAKNWVLMVSELRRYPQMSYKSDIVVLSGKWEPKDHYSNTINTFIGILRADADGFTFSDDGAMIFF